MTERADDPYFAGPYGWVLSHVEALTLPVFCPGRQGVWRMNEEDTHLVLERMSARSLERAERAEAQRLLGPARYWQHMATALLEDDAWSAEDA